MSRNQHLKMLLGEHYENIQGSKTTCPNCVDLGKQNVEDKCLSVNMDSGQLTCHKCGYNERANTDDFMNKNYKTPPSSHIAPNQSMYDFFKGRGVSKFTVDDLKEVHQNCYLLGEPQEEVINAILEAKKLGKES